MGTKTDSRNIDTQKATLWHCFEDGWECYGEQNNKKARQEFFQDKDEALRSEKRIAYFNEQQALIKEYDEDGKVETQYWITEASHHKKTECEKIKGSNDKKEAA